jgi:hypothetical protein
VLWKTFVSNLQETPGRRFNALLLSIPDGFLDNVKNLRITSYIGPSEKVMQLLFVLTKNTLRTLELSTVNTRTLGLLIHSQTLIEKLTYQQKGTKIEHAFPDSRFLAGNFQKLRSLNITPQGNSDNYSVWLLNTPALNDLRLIPSHGVIPRAADLIPLKMWKPPVGFVPLRLRRLTLISLNLSDNPDPIGKIIRLSSLETLEVRHCIGVSHFLQHLTTEFSVLDKQALKSLFVLQPFNEPDLIESLNPFIGCFSGLRALFVATSIPGRIDVDKICRHGKTLQFLHLDPLYRKERLALSDAGNNYTAAELATLVAGCPHIEELGIHAAAINLPALGAPFSVPKGETLAKALDVLARFASLRSLRFTHLIAADENRRRGIALVIDTVQYTQLATDIMRYLSHRGSPIQIYSTSPTITPGVPGEKADMAGHTWPHYHYVRGTLTLPRRGQCHTQIQAVGMRKEEIVEFVRSPAFLSRVEQNEFHA